MKHSIFIFTMLASLSIQMSLEAMEPVSIPVLPDQAKTERAIKKIKLMKEFEKRLETTESLALPQACQEKIKLMKEAVDTALKKKGSTDKLKAYINYCTQKNHHTFLRSVNADNKKGQSALHRAAEACKIRCLKLILSVEHDGSLNETDFAGWTALHYASRAKKRGAKKEIKQ